MKSVSEFSGEGLVAIHAESPGVEAEQQSTACVWGPCQLLQLPPETLVEVVTVVLPTLLHTVTACSPEHVQLQVQIKHLAQLALLDRPQHQRLGNRSH